MEFAGECEPGRDASLIGGMGGLTGLSPPSLPEPVIWPGRQKSDMAGNPIYRSSSRADYCNDDGVTYQEQRIRMLSALNSLFPTDFK